MGTGRTGLSRLRQAVSARLPGTREPEPAAPATTPVAEELGPPNPPLPDEPLLSVVVPVYDVEAYLEECLDSILGQDYRNLEVLIVDDGSPDRSAEIARRYVERDPRCRLISQQNAGLGAARNTGIEAATGDLLAFCDSDDYVLPGAYRTLVRTLVRSGSDFVVGSYRRDEPDEGIRPWMKQAHAVRRTGVRLEDVTEILPNVFAWTKVFRRDFVDRLGLRFPVGVRYEDQVPITHAYLMSRGFDVVPDPVYLWRRREDGSSITQQKGQAADLHDRLAAKREIAHLMRVEAGPEVALGWYVKVFRIDMITYFRVSGEQDEDYWTELSTSTRALLDEAPEALFDHIEVRFRVAAWLAGRGEREAVNRLLAFEDLNSSNFAVRSRDGDLFADLDFVTQDTGVVLPDDLLRLRPCDLLLRPHLTGLDWTRPGRLGVRALAVVRHVDPRLHPVSTSLVVTTARGSDRTTVPCRVDPDPMGNVAANRLHEDHTDSTVVGEIDLAALVRASGPGKRTRWVVEVEAEALGASRTGWFDQRRDTGSAALARAALVEDALVVAEWSERRGLVLEVRRRFVALEDCSWQDGALVLDLRMTPGTEVAEVLVGGDPVPATWDDSRAAEGRLRLSLPAAEVGALGVRGRIRLECGWPVPAPVMLTGPLGHVAGPPEECPVALEPHAEGMVRVVGNDPTLLVDDVVFAEDQVTVTGRAVGVDAFTGCLRGPRAESLPAPATVADGRFEVVLPSRRASWGGRDALLPANAYQLAAADGPELRVRAGDLAEEPTPRPSRHRWTVEVPEGRLAVLRLGRQEDPAVLSGYAQRELVEGPYAAALTAPRRRTLVLESFGGTAAGDTPRAVCDLLLARGTDLDLVWSVNDPAVQVPDGTRSVTRHTPEWYDEVGHAAYLVNNTNFPPRFRKAAGQVYVQTWHGTPLKRIGNDIADQQHFSESYLRLMEREAAAWDYLVSPSPFCTEVFPRALGYDGPVLEIGYPRNDLLLAEDADKVRRTVRAELGLPDSQTVLLYAPTWREDVKAGAGYEKVLHLDAEAVTAARPDVTVLVRGHSNVAGKATVGDGSRVLDVTGYPDPARLYLAADLLVTDYSSAFFDFALTDKAILFLVPDLEDYRDELRGFYVDLAEIAPGPLLRSTDEVLTHLDDDPAGYADARARLRERFAPHDDGHAAERLVRAMLGPD